MEKVIDRLSREGRTRKEVKESKRAPGGRRNRAGKARVATHWRRRSVAGKRRWPCGVIHPPFIAGGLGWLMGGRGVPADAEGVESAGGERALVPVRCTREVARGLPLQDGADHKVRGEVALIPRRSQGPSG